MLHARTYGATCALFSMRFQSRLTLNTSVFFITAHLLPGYSSAKLNTAVEKYVRTTYSSSAEARLVLE